MKSLRPREREKELADDFTIKPKREIERVWDAVRLRDSLYVSPNEMGKNDIGKKLSKIKKG